MSDQKLRSLFLACTTVLALVGLWINVRPYACNLPDNVFTTANSLSCEDFWLNRYQTLFTACLALVVALYAAVPAWRQANVAEQQLRLAMKEIAVITIRNSQLLLEVIQESSALAQSLMSGIHNKKVTSVEDYDNFSAELEVAAKQLATAIENFGERAAVSTDLNEKEIARKIHNRAYFHTGRLLQWVPHAKVYRNDMISTYGEDGAIEHLNHAHVYQHAGNYVGGGALEIHDVLVEARTDLERIRTELALKAIDS